MKKGMVDTTQWIFCQLKCLASMQITESLVGSILEFGNHCNHHHMILQILASTGSQEHLECPYLEVHLYQQALK